MLVRKWKVKYNKVPLLKIYVYWFNFPIFPVLFHIMVIKRIIRSDCRERSKQRTLNSVSESSLFSVLLDYRLPSPKI